MLDSFKKALEELEKSFKGNAKGVSDSTVRLNTKLNELKLEKLNLSKYKELGSSLKLIERLSIQNEYKLNLLKEFSSIYYQKK